MKDEWVNSSLVRNLIRKEYFVICTKRSLTYVERKNWNYERISRNVDLLKPSIYRLR